MPRVIKTVCSHDCPDACSVLITLDEQDGKSRAVQFRGDPDHPFTRGFLCGKVNSYERYVYDSERVLYPMRRVGEKGAGEFERISWDDAVAEIARQIESASNEHGGESLLQHYYGGTMASVNRRCGDALFHKLGATRLDQNICYFGAEAGYRAAVGSGYGLDPEDLVHSDLIIVWGCNVVTTNVHLMQFIDAARRNGAKLVVIDPYRNRTARKADEWIRVRPGTDTALALGMMKVIESEGLLDEEFIKTRSIGYEKLSERSIADWAPARCSEVTGVPKETIIDLARRVGSARAPAFKVGIGLGRSSHGASAVRSVCTLAGVVGAYAKLGGGVQYDTGCEFRVNAEAIARPDWLEKPTRQLKMTDLAIGLDEWSDPPIRFLWVHTSNPLATSPLQDRLFRGFAREDLFTVVHEIFLTDTAKYADLYKSYGHLYLQFGKQAIEPLGEAKSNLETVQLVARALGLDDPWFERSIEDHVRALLDTDDPNFEGIDVERVLAGETIRLNLPKATPGFRDGFKTSSGKFEFASEELAAAGFEVVEFRGDPFDTDPDRLPLRLLTPPAHSFCNSTFGASAASRSREKSEPVAWLHPEDVPEIATGDEIELFNDLGTVRLLARVTDETNPGTVIVEGTWWASHFRGGRGINTLTSNRLTEFGGGSTFHDNRVGVLRI